MPDIDPLEKIRTAAQQASPALREIADWILRHSAQAATLGIVEIAKASGGSTASINRLARAAGFSGFAELRARLAQEMRAVIDPIQRLREEKNHPQADSPARDVAMACANLERLYQENPPENIRAAAQLLSTKGRIYILGFGLTAHICNWLAYALTPYSYAVLTLTGAGGYEQSARGLTRIGPDDVLVAISMPRYSATTIQLAHAARDRGARVLAIVDSPAAPLAGEADICLYAPAAHSVLSASLVSLQTLCEILFTEVLRQNPDAVTLAAEHTESITPYLAEPRT